jgi:hypothetical protein
MPDFSIESERQVCFATDLGTCSGRERNNWELFGSPLYIPSLLFFRLKETIGHSVKPSVVSRVLKKFSSRWRIFGSKRRLDMPPRAP